MTCRTYTIPGLTSTVTGTGSGEPLYWGGGYYGLRYWGGLYWGISASILFGVPVERTYLIPADSRTYSIPIENRTFTIPACGD